MMLLYLWNIPETESMRKEENRQMARHICFMTTKLSAKDKFLLFLMVIFKNLILSLLVFTMILQAESAREIRTSMNTRIFVSLYTRIFVVAPSHLVKLLLKTEIEIYLWSVAVHSSSIIFFHFTKLPNVYDKYLQFLCDSSFHKQYNLQSCALFQLYCPKVIPIVSSRLTLKSAFVYCNPKIFILKKCIW